MSSIINNDKDSFRDACSFCEQAMDHIMSNLDNVLVGQKNVKNAVASALFCSNNSKILLTGNTGFGKTTLASFLSTAFDSERISVTSDMIPSDVQDKLCDKTSMNFLQIDEFNRASGKVQSVFIELLAEQQMNLKDYTAIFGDFYVVATQNENDVAGIFNVPQALYDRFDINVYFDSLTNEELASLLFDFTPSTECTISRDYLIATKNVVDSFGLSAMDKKILLRVGNIIDSMKINDEKVFAGSNIRAHKFLIRLAITNAIINGRGYIMPTDVIDYIEYVYMHRIDQSKFKINSPEVKNRFEEAKEKMLTFKINK